MAMQPRRRAPAARWLAVTALVAALAGCTPQSVTEQGRAIYDLYNLFMYIAAVVFVVVSGLVICFFFFMLRRAERPTP